MVESDSSLAHRPCHGPGGTKCINPPKIERDKARIKVSSKERGGENIPPAPLRGKNRRTYFSSWRKPQDFGVREGEDFNNWEAEKSG